MLSLSLLVFLHGPITMLSVNESCSLESAFQTVNSSYNWTHAKENYNLVSRGDMLGKEALKDLWAVNAERPGMWYAMPGCFVLGTLNRTKVEECEAQGGMAILNSRTKTILDADVWFCGLQGGPKHRDTVYDTIVNVTTMKSNLHHVIICSSPSAAHRISWSWAPVLLVAITSLVTLL